MRCPQCGERETRVVDSRDLDDSATIRRRRECAACSMRFTTYERVEAARLVVVKRDGTRQEFDRDKLASGPAQGADPSSGARRACAETAADEIEAELRASGASEIPSSKVGALAMEHLRAHRPDRLHPLRERVPELRGPRGAQARGRHAVCGEGQRGLRQVSVLSDRDIRAELEGGRVVIRPVRPGGPPAVVGRPPPGPQSFRVFRNNRYPYIDVRAPQPDLTELVERRGRRAVHPPPGRVRPRADARVGRAAGRPRRPARGSKSRWAVSACSSTRPRATSTRAGRAT